MLDDWIFEVPVYRVDHDTWLADARRRIERRTSELLEPWIDQGWTPAESDRARADIIAHRIEQPTGWHYNEVVGWIRSLWDGPGPVIKGYLWLVGTTSLNGSRPRMRYQRGFHPHPFVGGFPTRKVIEHWIDAEESDAEIYGHLRAGLLQTVAHDGELPGRHVDLSALDGVGPYVRWRELVRLPS